MRNNPDVISQCRFQIFKVPFVLRIADFLEPLLRLRDRDIFGFGMQNVDLNLAFTNLPFLRCCRRERICKRCVAVVRIIGNRFVPLLVTGVVTNRHLTRLILLKGNHRFLP